jgi:hypothetical protein
MKFALCHEILHSLLSLGVICKVAFETMTSDLEKPQREKIKKFSQALDVCL